MLFIFYLNRMFFFFNFNYYGMIYVVSVSDVLLDNLFILFCQWMGGMVFFWIFEDFVRIFDEVMGCFFDFLFQSFIFFEVGYMFFYDEDKVFRDELIYIFNVVIKIDCDIEDDRLVVMFREFIQ